MTGFEADPALLRTAAARLGDLVEDCASRRASRYSADPALAGDALLGLALGRLQEASAEAAKILFADAGELGERLAKAGDLYSSGQDAVQEHIRRIADALERPGAGPAD
ncbi:hypothetical protein [Amycolatopsis sp. cmx-4-68]|uniref:hypothetical protein n=1 Tax=Amycolatopsis sp. cmx-4-68 TaxID=2790938 RepID=UPI00397B783A